MGYYGRLLLMRMPAPVTVNKAGANYKSEAAHTEYSPRRALLEWMSICDAVVASGGDVLFDFEPEDAAYLDQGDLEVGADGVIHPLGSALTLGHIDDISTGRVFTANGPWVLVRDGKLHALMPNMLPHRRFELPYFERVLSDIARASELALSVERNPYRWEGLADVAPVGEKVFLTYTTEAHYAPEGQRKSLRSSLEGVSHAAEFAGVAPSNRVLLELTYPHFHGDTVHFGLRPKRGEPMLAHYAGGIWHEHRARVSEAIGEARIEPIEAPDAVEYYAANSRQIEEGVLVPEGASSAFLLAMHQRGLTTHVVRLHELFGKAGGGPACATLYLPSELDVPNTFPLRYSCARENVAAHLTRVADTVCVDPLYFEGKQRG